MNLSFEHVYNSKSKFLQKYIDYILMYNKRGEFVLKVFLRLKKLNYPLWCKINFKVVQKHLDSKFSDWELEIIRIEKENRADIKRLIKQSLSDEAHNRQLLKLKTSKLRVLEGLLMKNSGFTYKQISKEFGINYKRTQTILKSSNIKNFKYEARYLQTVLSQIIKYID